MKIISFFFDHPTFKNQNMFSSVLLDKGKKMDGLLLAVSYQLLQFVNM